MKLAYITAVLFVCSGIPVLAQTTPFAFTQAAGPVTSTGATLNGMVVPNGADTAVWFEWGTISSYGQTTLPASAGSGSAVVRMSADIAGLAPQSNFLGRMVASNEFGVTYGAPVLFTTGRKIVAWRDDIAPDVAPGFSNLVAVSAGYYHILALKVDGTVLAWGDNSYGQTDVPEGLTNVAAVGAGGFDSLALKSDGTVSSWGYDGGWPNVPPGLSNVVAVAAGFYHSLALKSDGTVVAWGYNWYGQANVPTGLSNVVAVAAGSNHSLALKFDGTVVAWGDDSDGETDVPAGLSNVVAVACQTGGRYNLALKSDGTVVGWGSGATDVPTGLSNVVAVAASLSQGLALKEDGAVVAWGASTTVPQGLSNVAAISGLQNTSLVLGNLPPQARDQVQSGFALLDLTVTLLGSDPNSDTLTYRVVSMPKLGTLYQWTPGGRGSPITAPGTVVNDAGGRVIFTAPVIASDSFTFIANDGLVDSGTAVVSITTTPSRACTQAVQPAGSTAATLCGSVAAGSGTKVWFEWGIAGGYGQATEPMDIGTDGLLTRVTTLLTNLIARSNYQCRLVVSNASGVSFGAPVLFTTGQRVSAWGYNDYGQTTVPPGLNDVVAVTGGTNHSLVLNSDGTLVAWGNDTHGQASVRPGLSNVISVAAGGSHNLAVKADGTVVAWGDNSYGQINVPLGLSNAVAVAGGVGHSLALRSDGTVVAWGDNSRSQTAVPVGVSNVVAVAAGGWHSLALKSDGTVVAWGYNNFGQTSGSAGLSNILSIAGGQYHSVGSSSDGSVVEWGWNQFGQLNLPPGLSNVVLVAGGQYHSLSLNANGSVAGWGLNGSNQTTVPAGLSDVVDIAAGANHSLALGRNVEPLAKNQTNSGTVLADLKITLGGSDPNSDPLKYRVASLPKLGTLYQWTPGGRGSAITVPGSTIDDAGGRVIFTTPVVASDSFTFVANDGFVDSAPAVVSITTTPSRACTQAVQPAGSTAATLCGSVAAGSGTKVWFEWGIAGGYGQTTEPMDIGTDGLLTRVTTLLTNLIARSNYQCRLVVSNASGLSFGAAVLFTTGQRVSAWGYNDYGQTSVPPGLTNLVTVAGSGVCSLALRSDGAVVAWGDNSLGQTNIPVGLSNVVGLSGGDDSSLALKSDGTVVAWGDNSYGQTNVPAGLSNVIAVGGGGTHCLALKRDGTVVAWGDNRYGQANVPHGLSNVVAVSAGEGGGYHSLALKSDGRVVAWGYNLFGQASVPGFLTNVIAIAEGGFHSLALRSDGTVVGWGYNAGGPLFVPADLSNVVAVAAGNYHSLALKSDGTVAVWGYNNYMQTDMPAGLSNIIAVAGAGLHSLVLGNLSPRALTQTNSGAALADLTITLGGSDPNSDSLSYRVTSLPTFGTLYQWTSSGRGNSITSPNTLVTDAGGRVVFTMPVVGGDSFEFVANDGLTDSVPASVNVHIIQPPSLMPSSSGMNADGSFSLNFKAEVNVNWSVWGSTNLKTWDLLGSPIQLPPSVFTFTDAAATNWPQRFYRVTSP